MSDTYWVRHQGRSLGPYTLDKIRQMIRKGQVGRAQEMSTDGESWAPATTFPEVFQHAVAATVIQQPATAPTMSLAPLQSGPTPPAVATEWYHASGGQQQGPVSLPGLLGMIRAGQLSASDLVYREGLDNWTAAGDVAELAAAFAPQVVQVRSEPVSHGKGAFCRECGAPINPKAVICTQCGVPQPSENDQFSFQSPSRSPRPSKQAQANGLIAAGYVCAAVSLLILPPVFALTAFIIGIISLARNQVGHGIAIVVLSVVCGLFGIFLGAAVWVSRFG